MDNKKLSKSIRKHIRKEKARIRRDFSGEDEQKNLIEKIKEKYCKKTKV